MKDQIELRYRDIDPDSGLVTSDCLIALVDPAWSKVLLQVLSSYYGAEAVDPNRDFYIQRHVDPDKSPKQVIPTSGSDKPVKPERPAVADKPRRTDKYDKRDKNDSSRTLYPGPKENWGYSSDPRDLRF
jgi:hypothetical protein